MFVPSLSWQNNDDCLLLKTPGIIIAMIIAKRGRESMFSYRFRHSRENSTILGALAWCSTQRTGPVRQTTSTIGRRRDRLLAPRTITSACSPPRVSSNGWYSVRSDGWRYTVWVAWSGAILKVLNVKPARATHGQSID